MRQVHPAALQHNVSSRPLVTIGIAIAALLLLSILSCRSNGPSSLTSSELIVSAAVSLKDAFNEIADLNEKRNGTKIHFNYGASGALQKQIESGAPVDVFASAGAKLMDELAGQKSNQSGYEERFCAQRAGPDCPCRKRGYWFV